MISLEGWGAIGQSVPKNISCRGKTAGKKKKDLEWGAMGTKSSKCFPAHYPGPEFEF